MEQNKSKCNYLGKNELDHLIHPLVDSLLTNFSSNEDERKRSLEIKKRLSEKVNRQFYHYCLELEQNKKAN